MANGFLDKLKARAKGLDMPVDPAKQPSLFEAVHQVFSGLNTKVTSDMYFAALELDRELSRTIGEAMHGERS
jgi:hypothetical protein